MHDEAENAELICTGCGERNPLNFAACWKCGESLEEAEREAGTEPAAAEGETSLSWRSVRRHLVDHRWEWCELLAVLSMTFVYRLVGRLMLGDDVPQRSPVERLIYLPNYFGWILLLWVLIRRDRSATQPVLLMECRWWAEALWGVLITLGGFALWYALIFVTHDMRLHDGGPPPREPVIAGWGPWLAQGTLFLFAAAYEEMMYRVYLQAKIESLLGDTVISIVISAVLFAASHGYPPASTVRVFGIGLMFGTIYYFTRRVPRLVLGHWWYNLLIAVMTQR